MHNSELLYKVGLHLIIDDSISLKVWVVIAGKGHSSQRIQKQCGFSIKRFKLYPGRDFEKSISDYYVPILQTRIFYKGIE